MDNIQTWVYVIFAVIYFLSRALKKKKPQEQADNRPTSALDTEEPTTSKPTSFEDLLEEITGMREIKEDIKPSSPKNKEIIEKPIEVAKKPEPKFEEGRTRRFSDDESRKIYERSIARAESSSEGKDDDDYARLKSKLKSKTLEEDSNELAQDIKEMLQDPESAQKAVILGEILNRKY